MIGLPKLGASASRTVREYTEKHYLPAAAACHSRSVDRGAIARRMADWVQSLDEHWATLRFGELKVETRNSEHLIDVEVYFNELDPGAVRVELYADGIRGEPPARQEMQRVGPLAGLTGGFAYHAAVSAARSPADYTPRVIAHCDGVPVPLENSRILWQR